MLVYLDIAKKPPLSSVAAACTNTVPAHPPLWMGENHGSPMPPLPSFSLLRTAAFLAVGWLVPGSLLAAGSYNGKSLDEYCSGILRKSSTDLTDADRGRCKERYKSESELKDQDVAEVDLDGGGKEAKSTPKEEQKAAQKAEETRLTKAKDDMKAMGIEDIDGPAPGEEAKGGKKAKTATASAASPDEDLPGGDGEEEDAPVSDGNDGSPSLSGGDETPAEEEEDGGDDTEMSESVPMLDDEAPTKAAKKKTAKGEKKKKGSDLGDKLGEDDGAGLD